MIAGAADGRARRPDLDELSELGDLRELGGVEALAKLRHELKNALSAASIHLDLLADGGGASPDRIDAVRDALAQALGLSDRLCGGRIPRDAVVELAELVRQCVRLARPAVERAGSLDASIPARIGRVHLDEIEAREMVLNLLLNAGEALEPGGHVRVSIESARAGKAVRLVIADDGVGIAADALDRVLVPGVTSRPDGSGLGLPRARELAEKAGGRLWISSELGVGTAVFVELPPA